MRLLGAALIVMVLAFAAATYSSHLSNQAAADTREALCKVLLYARKTKMAQANSISQLETTTLYYADLIALVKGCRVP